MPLLLWTLAEGYLRLAYSDVLVIQENPRVYAPHETFGYAYIPGTHGRICRPGVCRDFQINDDGYLGVRALRERTMHLQRIALVDDSNGTGIWQASGDNYAVQLESRLRSAGHRVEVLNFSVDGRFRDVENARIARQRALEYLPDVLLLSIGLPFVSASPQRAVYGEYVVQYPRDVPNSLGVAQREIDFIESHGLFKWTYGVSFLVRGSTQWFMHRSSTQLARYLEAFVSKTWNGPLLGSPESLTNSVAMLREISRLQEEHGGILVLFGDPGSVVAGFARDFRFNYIGVKTPQGAQMRHERDIHWTEPAHRQVSAELAQELGPLLDKLKSAGSVR